MTTANPKCDGCSSSGARGGGARAAAGVAPPLDLSHHLSAVTKRRAQSKIKKFYKYFQIPGIGQLAGGRHYSFFTEKLCMGAWAGRQEL
jgi:hypothetical protein